MPRGKERHEDRRSTQKNRTDHGATDGLGKALALLLAERGYRVFGRAFPGKTRRNWMPRRAKRKCRWKASRSMFCSDDSVKAWRRACSRQSRSHRRAGQQRRRHYTAAVEDLSMEAWRAQFETNFFGVLRVTRAVLPQMRERRSGRILMMSSISGLVTAPTQGAYSSSQTRARSIENALRMELYPFRHTRRADRAGLHRHRHRQSGRGIVQALTWKRAGRTLRSMRDFSSASTPRVPDQKTTPEDCARVMLHAIGNAAAPSRVMESRRSTIS